MRMAEREERCMNKTFGEFFRPFFNLDSLPEPLVQGVLESLEIDPVNRCVSATVSFSSLVEREALYEAERRVAMAPGLQLTRASLHPKFPPEAFFNQAIDLIGTKIVEGNYMKDPLVSIEFLNFKYTVMGAVASTGNYSVTGDRVTIFEALARAGGLTQKARLDRITVFREVGDSREMYVTDIRSKEIFNSPCYYLQQNDIVYAEPKYLKKDAEDRGWQIGTTVLSVVTAVCSVLWAINSFN